jgi:hypothetical protein
MSNPQKINYIRHMLSRLSSTMRGIPPNVTSDKVFELFCYFKKIEEFAQTGRTPVCEQSSASNIFRPNLAPGNCSSGDCFRLEDPHGGEDLYLTLNGTFSGHSGIEHSPDIVLSNNRKNKVISFYECKNYSHTLGPNVYRELIGYCKEFGVVGTVTHLGARNIVNTYSHLAPCVYTSALADDLHIERMFHTYNIRVFDLM